MRSQWQHASVLVRIGFRCYTIPNNIQAAVFAFLCVVSFGGQFSNRCQRYRYLPSRAYRAAFSYLKSSFQIQHLITNDATTGLALCSCQSAQAMTTILELAWSTPLTKSAYIKLILENNWIWGWGRGRELHFSLMRGFIQRNPICPYSAKVNTILSS